MTCIFHFPLCTSKGIKHPFENKNIGPRSPKQLGLPVSIIFSLSLLLFFRLIPWSIEALCNVNQGISASFSPLFSYLQYSFLISLNHPLRPFFLQVPMDPAGAGPWHFSIFGCKEYNQSVFGVDHLVMSVCRVFSCVVGRGCLL